MSINPQVLLRVSLGLGAISQAEYEDTVGLWGFIWAHKSVNPSFHHLLYYFGAGISPVLPTSFSIFFWACQLLKAIDSGTITVVMRKFVSLWCDHGSCFIVWLKWDQMIQFVHEASVLCSLKHLDNSCNNTSLLLIPCTSKSKVFYVTLSKSAFWIIIYIILLRATLPLTCTL